MWKLAIGGFGAILGGTKLIDSGQTMSGIGLIIAGVLFLIGAYAMQPTSVELVEDDDDDAEGLPPIAMLAIGVLLAISPLFLHEYIRNTTDSPMTRTALIAIPIEGIAITLIVFAVREMRK